MSAIPTIHQIYDKFCTYIASKQVIIIVPEEAKEIANTYAIQNKLQLISIPSIRTTNKKISHTNYYALPMEGKKQRDFSERVGEATTKAITTIYDHKNIVSKLIQIYKPLPVQDQKEYLESLLANAECVALIPPADYPSFIVDETKRNKLIEKYKANDSFCKLISRNFKKIPHLMRMYNFLSNFKVHSKSNPVLHFNIGNINDDEAAYKKLIEENNHAIYLMPYRCNKEVHLLSLYGLTNNMKESLCQLLLYVMQFSPETTSLTISLKDYDEIKCVINALSLYSPKHLLDIQFIENFHILGNDPLFVVPTLNQLLPRIPNLKINLKCNSLKRSIQ